MLVPTHETALRVYRHQRYKMGSKKDIAWAIRYLKGCVASDYITQEEADAIRVACGEEVKLENNPRKYAREGEEK